MEDQNPFLSQASTVSQEPQQSPTEDVNPFMATPEIMQTPQISQTPSDVTTARQYQAAPPINPNTGDATWANWCQAYVEKATSNVQKFGSATEAADNYASAGKLITNPSGVKSGNLIYFNDPNQPYGHVGIVTGKDTFISATPNGIKEMPIKDWLQQTGQSITGFVAPSKYLQKIGGDN